MKLRLTLVAGALLIGGTVAAPAGGPKVLAIQPNSSAAQVQSALEAAGYGDVRNVERRGGIFVARARWDGKPVELRVNGRTGEVDDGIHIRDTEPGRSKWYIYDRKGPGQHAGR